MDLDVFTLGVTAFPDDLTVNTGNGRFDLVYEEEGKNVLPERADRFKRVLCCRLLGVKEKNSERNAKG